MELLDLHPWDVSPKEAVAIQRQLASRLHAYFRRVADPKWDLWKGGTSKSGLIWYVSLAGRCCAAFG